jgi:hypothetical protein
VHPTLFVSPWFAFLALFCSFVRLVIPLKPQGVPSYGNAGQFACDAVCVTLQSQLQPQQSGKDTLVGSLEHAALLPMAAFDLWPSGKKRCFPAEVHWFEAKQLLVVLVRTQYVASMKQQFTHDLLAWLHGVVSPQTVVVTLCSASLEGRDDDVINSNRFFCAATSMGDMQQRLAPQLAANLGMFYDLSAQVKEASPYRGGDISSAFLEECSALGMPALVLGRFCTEGDNTGDGVQLAGVLLSLWLTPDVQPLRIQAPASWQLGYGPDVL